MSEDFGVVLQQLRGTMNMDPCMDAGWGVAEHHTRETSLPTALSRPVFNVLRNKGSEKKKGLLASRLLVHKL